MAFLTSCATKGCLSSEAGLATVEVHLGWRGASLVMAGLWLPGWVYGGKREASRPEDATGRRDCHD